MDCPVPDMAQAEGGALDAAAHKLRLDVLQALAMVEVAAAAYAALEYLAPRLARLLAHYAHANARAAL